MNQNPRVSQLIIFATITSGMAALIFQTLWARSFSIIFGSTVQASAVVFASFLIGVALGAYLAGLYSLKVKQLIKTYIGIECMIAVTAGIVAFLIHYADVYFASVLGQAAISNVLIVFPMALSAIIVPTIFMGATFPFLLVIARSYGLSLSIIGKVYGYNVLGAAFGTLLAGYVLIGGIGVYGTIFAAILFNLTSAALCYLLLQIPVPTGAEEKFDQVDGKKLERIPPQWVLWMLAFASGAIILGLEVIWIRLSSFYLGNRTFAFSTLLSSILLLLAFGSWLGTYYLQRYHKNVMALFSCLFLAATAGLIVSCVMIDFWLLHFTDMEAGLSHVGLFLIPYRIIVSGLLLAPALLPLGMIFPMALTSSKTMSGDTGKTAGIFYLINTVGSVIGSIGVGFGLILILGSYGSLKAIILICALVGVFLFLTAFIKFHEKSALIGCILALMLLFVNPLPNRLVLKKEPGELLYWHEDKYGIFQIIRSDTDGNLAVTNNSTSLVYRAGSLATDFVQQMQGHLAMMFRPESRKALVIGSGYGITAGALSLYSSLETIDAVEIIPSIVETADFYSPNNFNYHKDKRVHIHVDDGRYFLARSKEQYDIISVNVTDPLLPGASSLFHKEFYDTVKAHLSDQGVLVHHIFGVKQDIVLATLAQEFEYVYLYNSYANGFNVVASQAPLNVDALAVKVLLQKEKKVKDALEEIGIAEPVAIDQYLQNFILYEDMYTLGADAYPIVSDNHPIIEFALTDDPFDLFFLNQ